MIPLPPGILRGIELFNRGQYFEAHEVMEDVWRDEHGPARPLYQGMIQASVACHHLSEGNPAGARKMIAAASRKLESFREERTGVDVASLLATLRSLSRAASRGGAPLDECPPRIDVRSRE